MGHLSQEVLDLYKQGKTQKQIRSELGCSLNTVRRRMSEQGLKGKSVGSRNYKVNSTVFREINSEGCRSCDVRYF